MASRSCASKGFGILSTESRTSLFSGSIKELASWRKKQFIQCRRCTIKRKKKREKKEKEREREEKKKDFFYLFISRYFHELARTLATSP